jgi:hypothetical protein
MTTTITTNDQPQIFDHELDEPSLTQTTPRMPSDDRDRMLEQLIAESHEQRMRERRREEQTTKIRRRRTRGALATGTVAIVIAVGGTLFFLEGPSNGPSPQPASSGTPAAAIQPASGGSQTTPTSSVTPASNSSSSVPASNVTPSTPNPEIPSGNNIGNMGTGPGPSGNPQIPSGSNTGNMGSNGGPLNGSVSQ